MCVIYSCNWDLVLCSDLWVSFYFGIFETKSIFLTRNYIFQLVLVFPNFGARIQWELK
jgi:hypothetical protein